MTNARHYLVLLAKNIRDTAGEQDVLSANILDKIAAACNPGATITDEIAARLVAQLISVKQSAGELGPRDHSALVNDLSVVINGSSLQ